MNRQFSVLELESFLAATDEHLSKAESIVVIGGGALALGHDDAYRTTDIDTWRPPSSALLRACRQARQDTGLAVNLGHAGGSGAPRDFEDRLIRVLPDLHRLTVFVLNEYDVVLSKMLRGEQKDLDAIRKLHRRKPLDEDALIERYREEMTDSVGSRWVRDQNFLNLIDLLYGPAESERVRDLLRA